MHNDAKTTSAISNISLKITTILENCLPVLFNMKTPDAKEEVCDKVRNQLLYYQNEKIKEEWYKKSEEEMHLENKHLTGRMQQKSVG